MNRQYKRMAARQRTTTQDRVDSLRERQRTRAAAPGAAKKRTPPRQFVKEVRQELKKVAWPSRQELLSYTTVVLVAVVVLTALVFGMDFGLANGIIELLQ